ncbi:MAG: hypothetical protein QM751_07950 [Paludibacteraceae bacterium]
MTENYVFSVKLITAWTLTPFLAAISAYGFYTLLRKFFLSSKIHLLKIEAIVRILFITGCLFFIFSVSVNNVSVTAGIFSNYFPQTLVFGKISTDMIYFLLCLGAISVATGIFLNKKDGEQEKEYLTLDVSFSALFVSAIWMMIFSFVPGIFVPLSATQLVLASIMGIGLAKGNKSIDWIQIRKTVAFYNSIAHFFGNDCFYNYERILFIYGK